MQFPHIDTENKCITVYFPENDRDYKFGATISYRDSEFNLIKNDVVFRWNRQVEQCIFSIPSNMPSNSLLSKERIFKFVHLDGNNVMLFCSHQKNINNDKTDIFYILTRERALLNSIRENISIIADRYNLNFVESLWIYQGHKCDRKQPDPDDYDIFDD